MAGDRIDSLTEAKQLQKEHREEIVATFLPQVAALANIRHGVTGVTMDGIDVDFATLRDAEKELSARYDDLLGHLRDAAELTTPFGDGTSPVTGPMRRAFRDRADMEGGVQNALLEYLEEVLSVRLAILQTLATYEGVETYTVDQLNRQLGQLEELA